MMRRIMDAILNKDAMDDKVLSISLFLSFLFFLLTNNLLFIYTRKRYKFKMIRKSQELIKKLR